MLGMPGITDDSFFDGCEVVVRPGSSTSGSPPCPLEVRSAAAAWDATAASSSGVSTQHAHGARDTVAGRQRPGDRTTCA